MMTDFDLLLGKKGNTGMVWGRPCECCHSKPASGLFSVMFQSKYGPQTKRLRLCAQCGFTGANLRWSGSFWDDECKEIVPRRKCLSVKLIASITRY